MVDSNNLLHVRININAPKEHLSIFFPNTKNIWNDCHFEINPPLDTMADFFIVFWNAKPFDRFICSPENTLLIVGEPISKKIYPKNYYKQFNHLVDTHTNSDNKNIYINCPGLPWHVGKRLSDGNYSYGYHYLNTLTFPMKINKISVICSNAKKTSGQRERLRFLDYLKNQLGEDLVHFGKGFRSINDKMDAILPYRYHLVLENSSEHHYWTEKLADCYLGWSFPIYSGCPNLQDYFPLRSFKHLDLNDWESSLKIIRNMLTGVNTNHDQEVNAIREARELILNQYNPIARASYWAKRLYKLGEKNSIQIRSHRAFRPFPMNYLYRLRNLK